MRRARRVALLSLGLVTAVAGAMAATDQGVRRNAAGRVFTHADEVPRADVALVLGTRPTTDGRPNLFFERRLDAAAALYHAGRVGTLLVSGDASRRGYDEPTAMRAGLLRRGVPATAIVRDYAGLRTLDSVYRARSVFGVRTLVIVTDGFHLPRALYLARHAGIEAVGMASRPVSRAAAPNPYTREIGARACLLWDVYISRAQPRFPGPYQGLVDVPPTA